LPHLYSFNRTLAFVPSLEFANLEFRSCIFRSLILLEPVVASSIGLALRRFSSFFLFIPAAVPSLCFCTLSWSLWSLPLHSSFVVSLGVFFLDEVRQNCSVYSPPFFFFLFCESPWPSPLCSQIHRARALFPFLSSLRLFLLLFFLIGSINFRAEEVEIVFSSLHPGHDVLFLEMIRKILVPESLSCFAARNCVCTPRAACSCLFFSFLCTRRVFFLFELCWL